MAEQVLEMDIIKEGGPDVVEAIAILDRALGQIGSRELVSTSEVVDWLLDTRSALNS